MITKRKKFRGINFTYWNDFEEGRRLNAPRVVNSDALEHAGVGAYEAEDFQVVAVDEARRGRI